ncbi:BatD family protein [Neorhodopirellula lusitana]|uniref:BatD family protein n=1 Tax=Neorhodopirellula lusitana TaxID=445327 RepID=UPI00384E050E
MTGSRFVHRIFAVAMSLGLFALIPIQFVTADDVVVRTQLDPEKTVSIGERVVLKVDVLGKDAWAQLAESPSVRVPGAIVFKPPGQSTRLNETISGDNYTGQRYEWWIYPQRSGLMSIPEFSLSIQSKVFGAKDQSEPVSKSTAAVEIEVARPDGVSDQLEVLATSSLKATQSWSSDTKTLIVGDGITRTVEREIEKGPSLLLSPLDFANLDGVKNFVKQPATDDKINRGELTGSRRDEVTYVFEQAGKVQLPDLQVEWFDTEAQELKTETLQGRTLTIQPSPEVAGAQPSSDSIEAGGTRNHRSGWLVVAGTLALVLGGVYFYYGAVRNRWLHYLEARSCSEKTLFKRFVASAGSGDAARTLRDLVRWSDVVQDREPAPRLDSLFVTYGDADARQRLSELECAVDDQDVRSAKASFDGAGLIACVKEIRSRVRLRQRESVQVAQSVLPPLRG